MIEINLIPDVKQELLRAQRQRAFVITTSIITGVVAVGIVALLSGYVFGVQTVRFALAEDAIKKGSEQLAAVEDLPKVLTIQNQLNKLSILNEDKKIDSRLFDMLEAVVPPEPNEIQVASLDVDAETNSIVIEGQAPLYDSVEIFKKTIGGAVVTYIKDDAQQTDPLAENVSLSDISYGEDSGGQKVVRFTLGFTYPDSLLSANIPNTIIRLTNTGNVTDSYLGVPRSIFVTDNRGDN